MAAVPEGCFELDGYLFGGTGQYPVFVEEYDPGAAEWEEQDQDSPVGDSTTFGADILRGPTWSFQLNVHRDGTLAGGLTALEEVARAWRAHDVHSVPGALSVLRYTRGGRTRRVYGRARRFSFDPNRTLKLGGAVRVLADFKCADAWFWEDQEQFQELRLFTADTGGGWVFPSTFPVTSIPGGVRQGLVDNKGLAPTPVDIAFYGPVTDPEVSTPGWTVKLSATLAHDQSVLIDTRTKTVLRNDGANLRGKLSRRVRLADLTIRPGLTDFTFRGIDPTAQSKAQLRWRPKYNSL